MKEAVTLDFSAPSSFGVRRWRKWTIGSVGTQVSCCSSEGTVESRIDWLGTVTFSLSLAVFVLKSKSLKSISYVVFLRTSLLAHKPVQRSFTGHQGVLVQQRLLTTNLASLEGRQRNPLDAVFQPEVDLHGAGRFTSH